MTAISVVSICFGIVGTVAALVFGLMNISRNKKKDDSEEGWQGGTLFSELGYIKGGVDDICIGFRDLEVRIGCKFKNLRSLSQNILALVGIPKRLSYIFF